MAVISATFRLTDAASTTLKKIAAEAKATDAALADLDARVKGVDKSHRNMSSTVSQDAKSLSQDVRSSIREADKDLGAFKRGLDDFTNPSKARSRRNVLGSSFVGKAFGPDKANQWSKFWRTMSSGAQDATNWVGKLGDKFNGLNVKLGPVRGSLGTIAGILASLGSPVLGLIGTTLASLVTSVVALGVGFMALGVAASAVATGLLATVGPMAIAIKQVVTHRQQLQTAINTMDKYRAGTKAYDNALRNVHEIEARMGPVQMQLNTNITKFEQTWSKFVTNGPAGRDAMNILNSGLAMADRILPSVATEMDRFTKVSASMFQRMQQNMPGFQKQMQRLMQPWPHMFGTLGGAGGNFLSGLVNLMTALNPLAEKLSGAIARIAERFNRWTSNPKNMDKMTKFFNDMYPVISALAGFVFDIGKAMVDIAGKPENQRNTITFIGQLDKFVKGLVPFLTKLGQDFQPLWPSIDKTFSGLATFFETMAPRMNTYIGLFGDLVGKLTSVSGGARAAADGLQILFGLKLAGGVLDFTARLAGNVGRLAGYLKSVRSESAAGKIEGDAGKAASDASKASKFAKFNPIASAALEFSAQNVYVTNSKFNPASWVPVIIMGGGISGEIESELGGLGGLAPSMAKVAVGVGAMSAAAYGIERWLGHHGPSKVPSHPRLNVTPAHHSQPTINATPRDIVHPNVVPGGGFTVTQNGRDVTPKPAHAHSSGGGGALSGAWGWVTHRVDHSVGAQFIRNIGNALSGPAPKVPPWLNPADGFGLEGMAMAAPQRQSMAQSIQNNHSLATSARSTAQAVVASSQQGMNGITGVAKTSTQSISTVFSSAMQSIWQVFSSGASGMGSTLSSLASSAGSALGAAGGLLSGGGGAGGSAGAGAPSMGPAAPMGGMSGSHGGFAHSGMLSQLAPDYRSKAAALLNNLPGGGFITAVRLNHKKMTASGNVSQHYLGQALDIDYSTPGMDAKVGKWIQRNASQFGVNPGQVFFPGNDPTGEHSGSNSHVHIGFSPMSGPGGSVGAKGDGHGVSLAKAGHHIEVHFGDINVHNDDSYEEVVKKLVDQLERHLGTMTGSDASDMLGL